MATVAAGASAPAALAADDCPNAKVRAQQFRGAELPNCFAYERITPNDKNGSDVIPDGALLDDGSVVSVWSQVHLFDTDDSGSQNLGIATRGDDGWTIRMQTNTPLWGRFRPADLNDVAWGLDQSTSTDLQSLLFTTVHPIDSGDLGNGASGSYLATGDIYLSRPDGSMVWVSAPVSGAFPAGVTVGGTTDPTVLGATPDLDQVVFGTNRVLDPGLDATVRQHRWLWRAGHRVEAIDRLPDGSLSLGTGAMQSGMVSRDARTMVFTSSSLHGQSHVYARLGIGTPDERTVLVSASAAGAPCDGNTSANSLTADGRYVRFGCNAQLTPDAPLPGTPNAAMNYVRDLQTGAVLYDEPMVDRGPLAITGPDVRWTRPEGTYEVRRRVQTDPTPAGPMWGQQLMRVDRTTGDVVCVSCPSDGSAPTDQIPQVAGRATGASGGRGTTMRGVAMPDGEVVFATTTRLVPEDTNDHRDVYMWKDGRHHLLTSGVAPTHATLGGVSLDGSTITVGTGTAMVPEDRDGGEVDIYALRKNGGFYRAPEPAPCSAGCQGPASPPAAPTAPLSMAFPAAGDAEDDGADPIAVSGSRSVRGTSLKVKVRTPGAGRVTVSGSGLRSATRSWSKASSASLTVKLSQRSQRTLRRKGSIRVTASVRFVPSSGAAQVKRVNLTFRKKAASKKQVSSRSVAVAPNGKAAR